MEINSFQLTLQNTASRARWWGSQIRMQQEEESCLLPVCDTQGPRSLGPPIATAGRVRRSGSHWCGWAQDWEDSTVVSGWATSSIALISFPRSSQTRIHTAGVNIPLWLEIWGPRRAMQKTLNNRQSPLLKVLYHHHPQNKNKHSDSSLLPTRIPLPTPTPFFSTAPLPHGKTPSYALRKASCPTHHSREELADWFQTSLPLQLCQ